MLAGWIALGVALLYLLALFAIAYLGDRQSKRQLPPALRATIYALTLAVYCTSWTFLGSVGVASTSGLDFLPIYLGPFLAIVFGLPLLTRIVKIAKSQRITSVSDFIGARYGKSGSVAAMAALIAVVGTIPYIALQLKAISSSLEIIVRTQFGYVPSLPGLPILSDLSLVVTLVLAAFAIAFGTRNIDASEHQNGLMLAVATESLVKLLAFLAVGLFVVFGLFGGFGDLWEKVRNTPAANQVLNTPPDTALWLTTIGLAACAIFLLPRQFHVMVVENRDPRDLRTAAWQFPAYLVLINLFVLPIAMAGLVIFPQTALDRDFLVLTLPLQAGASSVTLIAFIGALSAATAMVIVESVACGIMISNDLVMPLLLRGSRHRDGPGILPSLVPFEPMRKTPVPQVLRVRRFAVVAILMLGFAYYRASSEAALAAIGLLSFSAMAQLAPAFFIGMFWSRANAAGARAGMLVGFLVWGYLLFLPTLGNSSAWIAQFLQEGPFGIGFLAPSQIMGTQWSPLVKGAALSLGLNTLSLVVFSLMRAPNAIERVQASVFIQPRLAPANSGFKLWRNTVSVGELQATLARYLGEERTKRAFADLAQERGTELPAAMEADAHVIRSAEQWLASAIGAASSRLVLSLMLKRRNVSTEAALKLLDDASAAMQHSRDLLQHGLDHARQGVTVFDRDLRLMCWNRAFQDIFDLPGDLMRFGVGLDEIIGFNARRGLYGRPHSVETIAQRIAALGRDSEPHRLALAPFNRVIEIRSNQLPDGGIVTTYTDITEAVAAEEALAAANASLEQRVRERTGELTLANRALAQAKQAADEANASKTRFLAAASHDIIQPLNAARLYASSLSDAVQGTQQADLAENVETSLNAVEEILSALIEISRLDGGRLKADMTSFALGDIFNQLRVEFMPIAAAKGLTLVFYPTRLAVTSDRRMVRRVLQNLISNAIKYTLEGRVVVGALRRGGHVHLVIGDTGIGIPHSKYRVVFEEFKRLEQGARIGRGLGLGLSIVERIVETLGISLNLTSQEGRGTLFRLVLPRADTQPGTANIEAVPTPAPFSPLAGLRLLVIDNEPAVLDAMRVLLQGWGCQISSGGNLEEAWAEQAKGGQFPQIVLVDYHLDIGNGLETIREVRSRAKNAALPAVLITAERSPEVRAQAEAEDVVLINKPVRPPALRALLSQLRLRVT